MRKRLTSLLALSLACSLPVGCGDAAASRSDYDAAIDKISAAERGFAPAGREGGSAAMATYRQQALAEAGEALDHIIASGSPAQKAGAYRLRAEVDASAARHAAREAATQYAQLAPQAIQRSSHALAASRAEARAGDTGTDQTPLLNSLRQTIQDQQQRQTELQQQAQQLRGELQTLEGQRAEIQQRRDVATAEVARLRNQAFVAKGEEQFRLQEEAATAERQSTLAAAELARKQLDIDMLNSRLGVVDSQLKLAERVLGDLQKRLEQTQARQAAIQQGATEAQQTQQEELQQLTSAYEQIWNQFKEQVDRRLDDASAQTQAAVDKLKQASSVAQGNRQAVQFDLLSALMTRVEILVEHLQTVAGFQEILELAAQTAGEDAAATLQPRIAELQNKRQQLAGLATTAITEGQQAAQQAMAGAGMDVAQQRAQRLEAYAQQVQRLQSAQ